MQDSRPLVRGRGLKQLVIVRHNGKVSRPLVRGREVSRPLVRGRGLKLD